MKSKAVEFWQTEGINYLRAPTGSEYYEGENNVRKSVELAGKGTIRDIGCGYGRLARFFTPENYAGYDICLAAVNKATMLNPSYRFVHWDFTPLGYADTTLFINGPSLIHEDDLTSFAEHLCTNTEAIVMADCMEHTTEFPFYFPREISVYDNLFSSYKFSRIRYSFGYHAARQQPYTIARWEHD